MEHTTQPGAKDVAAYLVELATRDERSIDQLGVLKLLYFAQGTALARLGRPLFPERIKAWMYGPVVPSVWHKTNKYGRGPVSEIESGNSSLLKDSDRAIIECVWSDYGDLRSLALVDLTHEEGSPWSIVDKARRERGGERQSDPIPLELIKRHFERELPPPLTESQKRSIPRL